MGDGAPFHPRHHISPGIPPEIPTWSELGTCTPPVPHTPEGIDVNSGPHTVHARYLSVSSKVLMRMLWE